CECAVHRTTGVAGPKGAECQRAHALGDEVRLMNPFGVPAGRAGVCLGVRQVIAPTCGKACRSQAFPGLAVIVQLWLVRRVLEAYEVASGIPRELQQRAALDVRQKRDWRAQAMPPVTLEAIGAQDVTLGELFEQMQQEP